MIIVRTVLCFTLVALLSPLALSAAKPKETKFLLMLERDARVSPDQLQSAGARVLAAYEGGGYAVAVPEAAQEGFLQRIAATRAEVRELDELIYAPRRIIDPRSDVPADALAGAGLFLIQYAAPATPAWQAAVRATGVVVVQPIPERAAVVAGTGEQVAALARLPWIQYAGPYSADFKFSPVGDDTGMYVVQIADAPVSADAIAAIERRFGAFVTRSSVDNLLTIRLRTDRLTAESLLYEPFVLGVETEVRMSPSDERQALSLTGGQTLSEATAIANSGTATGTNYRKWLNKYGFTPAELTNNGIVIDIADTGLDNGCSSSVTSVRAHRDLRGRIVYHNGATNPANGNELGIDRDPDYKDDDGHGTVVAGIAAGNPLSGIDAAGGATSGFGTTDPNGYYWGMGVAPGIRVGSTVIMKVDQTGDVRDWTTRAVSRYCNTTTSGCGLASPLRLCRATVQNVSSNEYTTTGSTAGHYTTRARDYDISVRRADHVNLIPLAVTVSAGNIGQEEGDLSTTVLGPATAKNVISLGAAESSRTLATNHPCTTDTGQGDNPSLRNKAEGYNVLAYASRRGTVDNRFKPDLLAPATLSTGPHSYSGGTYCLTAGTGAVGEPNPLYIGASGTSFAAPVAAGSIALLQNFYKRNYGHEPSPAMYKALLVAGARSIKNGIDRRTGATITTWPDAAQGFGVITLDPLFNSSITKGFSDQQKILLQSESAYYTVTVGNPSQPVKIVLAWTDAAGNVQQPGTTFGKALVNDLDLRATVAGATYYGNIFDSATSYSRLVGWCGRPSCPPPADVRNNVEVLNLSPALFTDTANRIFTVRVVAPGILGVGVPGASGGANNQDFALFVLNGTLQAQ